MNETTTKLNRRKFFALGGAGLTSALLPSRAKAYAASNFATEIKRRLELQTVGGQCCIIDASGSVSGQAWGSARLPHSDAPRPMSYFEKLNPGSVSKIVTAAALLKALYDNPNYTLDSYFADCLPKHWYVTENLRLVSFRHLLQHKTGLTTNHVTSYQGLKELVGQPIPARDPVTKEYGYLYRNTNYALMRLLIPYLAGASIVQVQPGSNVALIEQMQEAQYASAHISYTQKVIWDKTGVTSNMQCKPLPLYPALAYGKPATATNGTDYGDWTLVAGSCGWNASSFQLAYLLWTLHATTKIMPKWLSDAMLSGTNENNNFMGYDKTGTAANGISYVWKSGDLPYNPDPKKPYSGELRAKAVVYANGVYAVVMVNSVFDSQDLNDVIRRAFEATTW